MSKCTGLCKQFSGNYPAQTKGVSWMGSTAYYCARCGKRIPIEKIEKNKKGRATCPCCGEQVRTRAVHRGKWEKFAA